MILANKLEDPISHLHEDVQEVSKAIYDKFILANDTSLTFPNEFYQKYNRALTALATEGYIGKERSINSTLPLAVNLVNPDYILYMCFHFEDSRKTQEISDLVDGCEAGQTLDAELLADSIGLPKYAIRAVFEVYESKGLGFSTGGIKKLRYQAIA